ncbi:MAG: hypothetical protein ACRDXX_15305, partial [Stackebrandtia sp.]
PETAAAPDRDVGPARRAALNAGEFEEYGEPGTPLEPEEPGKEPGPPRRHGEPEPDPPADAEDPDAEEPEPPQLANGGVTLVLDLPEGMSSPGGDAGDGWMCVPGLEQVTCGHGPLQPGQETVAYVPLAVEYYVTGFHDIDATVEAEEFSGESVLRTPVAPPETGVAFAAHEASGATAAGNTLLTCTPLPHCSHPDADNHTSTMTPYTPGADTPTPPPGLGDGVAVSGARLDIPVGAEVLWAGLHWTSSGESVPSYVQFAGPNGYWHSVEAQRHWSGAQRPVHQAAADVTGIVSGGEFWLAADAASLPVGPWNYAGWSVTAVYRTPDSPVKETAVYEGLAQPRDDGALAIDVPTGGGVDVAYTMWDGDRTLTGDAISVGGAAVGNVGRGYSASALEGEGWNTFGVDVGVCSVDADGPTQAVIHAGDDPVEVGVIAVAAPAPEP